MKNLLRITAAVLLLVVLGAVVGAPSPIAQNAPEKKIDPFPGWNKRVADTHLEFRHYYPLAEVDSTIQMFAKRFPELCSVEVIGKSYGGRKLHALTLCNEKTGKHGTKPAMYIDSNIHGSEIQGTEIILVTIWYLLRNYGHEPWVTKLVNNRTFYFVPVVNVDSRHVWFSSANSPHTLRQNHRPWDNDRDGRLDEDPPNDLDGDGRITTMRVKDPNGNYVLAVDKRVMVRRRPGQKGEYRLLGSEGIDDDGDGRINEDGLGGVDLNRNFPSAWLPRHRQYGAGDYPCSEPEVRACVDFILARPNIAGMQFYHNAARMILRPPGSSSDAGVVPREDRRVYDRLGKIGERMIPGYRYLQTHDGLYEAHGTQIDFGYLGLGRFVFTNELWGRTGHDLNKDGRIDAEEARQWYDDFGKGRSYVEWKPYQHPTLGAIEIGGWDQFATRMPPAELFIEEGFRNALFTLEHAASFAELEFEKVRVTSAGAGLYRIRFGVRNRGLMPTDSVKAVQRHEDASVRVEVLGAQLIMCGTSDERGHKVMLQRGRTDFFKLGRIPGEGIRWGELIVRGEPGAEIKLSAMHPRALGAKVAIKLP